MYCSINFVTKSAFRAAVQSGLPVALYSPTMDVLATNGIERVEGPWPTSVRPRPRIKGWRAEVVMRNGQITEVH